MRTKKEHILIVLSLFIGKWAFGQTILEDYVAQGLEQNLTLQQEQQNVRLSLAQLQEAKSLFLPNVSFDASYTLANGGRTIDVPVGDLLNPAYATLNQLTGSENFPTDLQNASEPILPNDFHDTRLAFRQPIFNTDIYFNYKAQASLQSVQNAQRDAYIQELKKEIKNGYYRYIQSEEVLHIYDSTQTVLRELVRINQALVRNNKATKDVVYRAQFELDELYGQIALATRQRNIARSYFNFLLNRDLNADIKIDPQLRVPTEFLYADLETLRSDALGQREELQQLNHAIEANEYAHKLEKYNWLPKLSVGGGLGYQGFGYEFDENQDYSLLQFNLSIPLFTGLGNKAKRSRTEIQVAQLNTRYQELQQQIQVQVIDAYYNLEAADTVVQAKRSALESARENFRIVKRKYEENLVILVEFLDARVQYTNAQLDVAIAQYELLSKQAELDRALAL